MSRTSLQLEKTSYTNKDFNQVYPELLELAKELSYKWDPTVSNESDPGVVLIKEIALAIDKINYNTDKSALEQFPSTVQQESAARELFPLLGYYPKWYRSAQELLSIVYTGDTVVDTVIIPRFTMVKNMDEDLVYTITEQVNLSMTKSNAQSCNIIEGSVSKLKVNDSETITVDMLNDENKIFFTEYNIAQNGIFVYNESNLTYRWEQVDNMELEDTNSLCYQFGIDPLTNECYLQFPDWIPSVIDSGLNIWYCTSKGSEGLAPIGDINAFYASSLSCETANGDTLTITSDNISMSNMGLVEYGKDPETIKEMYHGYKKTCGTFTTLVTKRDYENALYLTEDVSNDKVCDRTNDIQTTYKIQKESIKKLKYEATPYQLKIYALNYVSPVEDKTSYNTTFLMPSYKEIEFAPLSSAIEDIEEYTLMNVEFTDLLDNKMCLFINKYDVKGQIYTNAALNATQKKEVTSNIQKALYTAYNSRQIDFSNDIDRDELITTIESADKRIVNLYLDDLNYQTYVHYYEDSSTLRTICISDECSDYIKVTEVSTVNGTCKVNGESKTYSNFTTGQYLLAVDSGNPAGTYTENSIFRVGLTGIELYSSLRDTFRNEVIAKSILAGVTPYFNFKDENFNYYPGEGVCVDGTTELPAVQQAETVTTNKEYVISLDQAGQASRSFTILSNNVIQFTRPSLYNKVQFGTYTKYEFVSSYRSRITANEDYKLQPGEYLTLVWSSDDNAETYTGRTYGQDTIINPSFNLKPTTTQVGNTVVTRRAVGQELPYEQVVWPNEVESLESLSASDSVAIRKLNTYTVDSNNLIYVISNTTIEDGKYYQMEINGSYVLKNGEYLLYTTPSKNKLSYVSSGTKITCEGSVTWICPVISQINITLLGINAFEDTDWIIPDREITIIEQEFINLTEDTEVTVNLRMPITDGELSFNSTSLSVTGSDTYTPTFSTELVKIGTGMTPKIDEFITDKYLDTLTTPHFDSVQLTAVVESATDYWQFTDKNSQTVNLQDTYYSTRVDPYYTYSDLPATGVTDIYYFVMDTRKLYKYSSSYTEVTQISSAELPEPEEVAENTIYRLTAAFESNPKDSVFICNVDTTTSAHSWELLVPGDNSVYYYFNFHNSEDPTQTGQYTFSTGNSILFNYFKAGTGGSVDISMIQSIDYTRPTGETGSIVPGSTSLSWDIRGYLNVKSSKDSPQTIRDDESITINGYTYTSDTESSTNPYKTLLESNLEIEVDGGENVSVKQLDETSGEYNIPYLRTYTLDSESTVLTELTALCTIPTTACSPTTPNIVTSRLTYLDAGMYVFKVKNKLFNLGTNPDIRFEYSVDDGTTWNYMVYGQSEDNYNIAEADTYFLKMVISNTAEVLIRRVIYQKGATSQTQYISGTSFYKVEKNSLITDDIDTLIGELDDDNEFNYLYEIDEDNLIENPVSSTSFFNTNHVFNEFVICQMNNYGLQIMR